MDLPSAANKVIEQLGTLHTSIDNIPVTLNKVVDLVIRPLSERVDQLESETRGNNFQDQIREAVQNYNDQVLAQKIDVISTGFVAELEELKKRFNDFENRPGSSYVQAELQAEGQRVEDTGSAPGNEPKPKQNQKQQRDKTPS